MMVSRYDLNFIQIAEEKPNGRSSEILTLTASHRGTASQRRQLLRFDELDVACVPEV